MKQLQMRPISIFVGLTVLALLPVPFVIIAFDGRWFEQMISHCFGVVSLMCMALTCVLSCRFPGINQIFAGLDKAYVVHKWLGLVALATLVVHDTLEAEIKGIPDQFGLHDLASELGSLVYDGLLILLAATFLHLIPYRWWRISHRLMIVVFIGSLLHFVLIPKPMTLTGFGGLYVLAWGIAGVLTGLYALRPRFTPAPKRFSVANVSRLGGNLDVTLEPAPDSKGMSHKAGQFAFFRRDGESRLDAHPFTLSRAQDASGKLQVTITPRANWTRALNSDIQLGDVFLVEGPHGRFLNQPRPTRQIWLSGGIGVTPFLAWAQEGKAPKGEVEILHVCRTRDMIPHLEILTSYADKHESVSLKIIETAANGRPTEQDLLRLMRDIPGRADIWYCGPKGLRKTLQNAVDSADKSRFSIHEETFQIRGTLPVPRWLRNNLNTLWSDFSQTHWGQRVEKIKTLRF